MKKILPLILLIAIAFISCTANVANPSDYDEKTWEGLFKQYWTVMDEDYVHFSRNDIDWDSMYNEYLSKFQALDYNNEADSFTAFRYFKEMSENITDYHFSLGVTDNFDKKLSFSPAMEAKWIEKNPTKSREEFPDIVVEWDADGKAKTYSSIKKDRTYTYEERKDVLRNAVNGIFEVSDLGDNHHNGTTGYVEKLQSDIESIGRPYSDDADWNKFIEKLDVGSLSYFFGVTDNYVAYFYISEFPSLLVLSSYDDEHGWVPLYTQIATLKRYYDELTEDEQESIDLFSQGLSQIILGELNSIGKNNQAFKISNPDIKYDDIKGMIFDVRSNGGGAVAFVNILFANFFQEDKVIGYTRYKDGYSKYEYTPWIEMKLTSILGDEARPNHDYDKPFAILTNEYSVSCSELSTLTVKKLMKNGKQFGITTWGGTCGLTDRNLYQSGPYKNSEENLSVYTTTYQFKDMDGKSYESEGFTPDEKVDLNTAHDNVFDKAVEWIVNSTN